MNLKITVHFPDSIYEYFLPGINNRANPIDIPADKSGLSGDVLLTLEVWNNVWEIAENGTMGFSQIESRGRVLPISKGLKIACVSKFDHVKFTVIAEQILVGYTEFVKYKWGQSTVTIGRDLSNEIQFDNMGLVTGKHAEITRTSGGQSYISDLNSRNGTFVNGRRIHDNYQLAFGDVIYIIGLKIVFLGSVLAINQPGSQLKIPSLPLLETEHLSGDFDSESEMQDEYYLRSPRQVEQLDIESVEIEAPPAPRQSRRQPLIFTIGPAFTMVIPMAASAIFSVWSAQQVSNSSGTSPFIFMGIITSVTAALIGVSWALANYHYSRNTEQREEKQRADLYWKYLNRICNLLANKHAFNREILSRQYPQTSDCLDFTKQESRRLWERNLHHRDFLTVRLGTGNILSPNLIIIPKERFSLVDDKLTEEPSRIQSDFKTVKNVPITISLIEHPLIGVLADTETSCHEIARLIATQVAAYHSYTDVRMVFVYNSKASEHYAFARWLPHVWNQYETIRMIASDATGVGEIFYHLSSIIRKRTDEQVPGTERNRALPHYVVFISDPSLVESEGVMKYLTNPSESMGITTILLYEKISLLPNACTVLIQKDSSYSGYYSLEGSFPNLEDIEFDVLSPEETEVFSRSLSNFKLREAQSESSMPQLLSFLDMYKTSNVATIDIERRWLENRTYESMRALIGFRGADTPLYLDIHEKYHGPHGLVAGTTGSGKSETLQTYILSMAANYHPSEVSFILIDYKGGGMAGSFEKLPHVTGIITNLGGNQTNRALASINSEIKRRQATFNDFKLKHIDQYIELYRSGKINQPIPHLIIIADEFAELKKEQPAFVKELVSASRIGRSLGIHLILATQKPSGVVDEEIWGNSKFHLCLRVQDKQDSIEMIRRPEAAYITNAGRGYFQVGNDEIFEAFQSGWSGARYEPETPYTDAQIGEVRMINLWGKPIVVAARHKTNKSEQSKKMPSQLEAVVEQLIKVCGRMNISPVNSIWLPPLKSELFLDNLADYEKVRYSNHIWPDQTPGVRPFIGLIDDPVNQRQYPLQIDLMETGNLMVVGSSGGGKTSFIQTMLYAIVMQHPPQVVNFYIADFSSQNLGVFDLAPHSGGIAYGTDPDRNEKLVALLLKELNQRKEDFKSKEVGSYKEYAKRYQNKPAIVFVIDNFAAYTESNPKLEESILLLSRDGSGYGIYLVLTCSNTNEIRGKIRQNLPFGIGIQLGDQFEYENALNCKVEITAEDRTPGRGLVLSPGPQEFQTALCKRVLSQGSIVDAIRLDLTKMGDAYSTDRAVRIPQVPADLSLAKFMQLQEIKKLDPVRFLPLGFDQREAEPVAIDLKSTYCFAISGTKNSGKTSLIKSLMSQAAASNARIFVFDGSTCELEYYSNQLGVEHYLSSSEALFDFTLQTLRPEFIERNEGKAAFKKNGSRDWLHYLSSQKHLYFFIGDMGSFCQAIYSSANDMKGFYEMILSQGDQHMIYFIAHLSAKDMTGEYYTKPVIKNFLNWNEGVYLGGEADTQKVLNFDAPYAQTRMKLPAGQGLAVLSGLTRTIIVPSLHD